MKKLGILITVFGLFILVGVASASTTDILQPAQTITYNEELVVNNTLKVNSAHIGSTAAGVGGVTFFNGTMINNSVDTNGQSTIPLTLGDDVRIDGEIYRTEVGGDNPLKISDSLRPQRDNHYALGEEDYQWTKMYAGEGYLSSLVLTGALTGTNATLTGVLTAATATFSGDITAEGDINQNLDDNGAVKAMVRVPADGDCTSTDSRQWTYNDSDITCDYGVTTAATYTVDFAFNLTDRFWTVTPSNEVAGTDVDDTAQADTQWRSTSADKLEVTLYGAGGAVVNQSGFILVVY